MKTFAPKVQRYRAVYRHKFIDMQIPAYFVAENFLAAETIAIKNRPAACLLESIKLADEE